MEIISNPSDDISKYITKHKLNIIEQNNFFKIVFPDKLDNGFESLGDLDNLKSFLNVHKSIYKVPETNLNKYNLPQSKGILLVGVQGCSKSAIAMEGFSKMLPVVKTTV